MRRRDTAARPSSLVLTTTTLVALVAVASGARSTSGMMSGPHLESVLAGAEAGAVRAVAAVVAAAARDLLAGTGQTTPALPFGTPPVPAAPVVAAASPAVVAVPSRDTSRLGPHRLDLPPPGC